LDQIARKNRLGAVFVESAFQLSEDTVRIPDVAFLPAERMKSFDLDHMIEGPPALAIDVVSPTDLAEDLARKVDQYLAAGAQSVWVIYLNIREVYIYRQGAATNILTEDEVLEDEKLLPGFSLPIRHLFE
jgi:Uma2 family endonuclease